MSPLIHWLKASHQFFEELGWLGIFAYAGVIVVAQLFLLPLSPFAVAAGVFFRFGGGLAAITLGTALGAAVNFLIARHVARDAITRRLARHEKFRLIDAAIGREGWKIIALLRFCPIPFGLGNFCYGLTAVRFWPYLLATIVAVIPANCFFVGLGSSAKEGLQAALGAGEQHPFKYVLVGLALVAALAALTYITRIARAAVANQGGATPAAGQG